MFRAFTKVLGMLLLMIAGAGGIYWYSAHDSTASKLHEAEAKNEQLKQIVTRLEGEKRVAEILVTDQKDVAGITQTTLFRWRRKFGGLEPNQAVELNRLQHENTRLKKVVAQLTLDVDILKEINAKKW